MEVFENAINSGHQQKLRFLKMLQDSTMTLTKSEHCERKKTDIFGSVFVNFRINVNGLKQMFFTPSLNNKNEARLASMQ